MKGVGELVKLRALWPPLPKVGEIVGTKRRDGKPGRKMQVVRVAGKTITAVVVPMDTPATFWWWWASRAQVAKLKALEARRNALPK